jgi:hypothetical protein
MTDKEFKEFLKKIETVDHRRAIENCDLIERAFTAGRAAQRAEDGEHRVTHIGQYL